MNSRTRDAAAGAALLEKPLLRASHPTSGAGCSPHEPIGPVLSEVAGSIVEIGRFGSPREHSVPNTAASGSSPASGPGMSPELVRTVHQVNTRQALVTVPAEVAG
jgi:hypothetical protein